jgi:hypothetical protein
MQHGEGRNVGRVLHREEQVLAPGAAACQREVQARRGGGGQPTGLAHVPTRRVPVGQRENRGRSVAGPVVGCVLVGTELLPEPGGVLRVASCGYDLLVLPVRSDNRVDPVLHILLDLLRIMPGLLQLLKELPIQKRRPTKEI